MMNCLQAHTLSGRTLADPLVRTPHFRAIFEHTIVALGAGQRLVGTPIGG